MTKRAILYARVSTDDQAERGYSLPTQLEACRQYAAQHGYIVPSADYEITDDYTGTKLDRPGLDKARAILTAGEAEAIIVYSPDRLTRKLAHSLVLRDEFNRTKIELHYCNRGKSENTPEHRMTENIEHVFSEYWREKIIEASRRGSMGKAKSGKVVGAGVAPYGYRYADGAFHIHETEAAIIRMIYQWYIEGDGDESPMAIYSIAEKLSLMGIPTPDGGRGKRRRIRPGIWAANTIQRFLNNETYSGVFRWGKSLGANGKGGKRPLHETVAISVPPIVSRAQWNAAQERLKHNKLMAARNCQHEYLLRGHIFCGCGRPMMALGRQRKKGWVYYYRCSSYYNYHASLAPRECSEKSIRGEFPEAKAWKHVLDVINSDAERFEQALREAQAAEAEAKRPKQERLETVKRLIVDCEARADELAEAIKRVRGLVEKSLQRDIDEIDREYNALRKERDDLEAELTAESLTDDDIAAALEFREDVKAGMDNPTFEDKRWALEVLRVSVTVKNGKVTVSCLIPKGYGRVESRTPTSCGRCHSSHPPNAESGGTTTDDVGEYRRCPIPRSSPGAARRSNRGSDTSCHTGWGPGGDCPSHNRAGCWAQSGRCRPRRDRHASGRSA